MQIVSPQTTQPMKFHPISEIWPMMSDEQLTNLAANIKINGQLNPIWLYEGMILDGRNRWKACELAGISPATQRYNGENPVAFAFSQNEERRHLSSGQRAALAVELKPRLEEEAKKRQIRKPMDSVVQKVEPQNRMDNKTISQAAKITGTNHTYVNQAEKVKAQAPEIFEQLKAGKISLQDATKAAARKPVDDWKQDERERQNMVQSGKSVVANYERDKNLISWAESQGLAVAVDRSSRYGNPFILDEDGDRDVVCDKYRDFYLPQKPSITKRLPELRGKVLCCHCYPLRCHAEALIK